MRHDVAIRVGRNHERCEQGIFSPLSSTRCSSNPAAVHNLIRLGFGSLLRPLTCNERHRNTWTVSSALQSDSSSYNDGSHSSSTRHEIRDAKAPRKRFELTSNLLCSKKHQSTSATTNHNPISSASDLPSPNNDQSSTEVVDRTSQRG
jgi:hypothetical protein